MNLSDYLAQMALGACRNLSIGGDGSGTIPPSSYPSFMTALNQALMDLYTKFALRRRALMIETRTGQWQYPMRPDFALTSGAVVPFKHIRDSAEEPFTQRLLKIDRIYNEKLVEQPLNVINTQNSWMTTSFDMLIAPAPMDGELFAVYVRLAADFIPNGANQNTLVPIPPSLEEALLVRAAYLIYVPIQSEGAVMVRQELSSRYSQLVDQSLNTNVANDSEIDERNCAIERAGWI